MHCVNPIQMSQRPFFTILAILVMVMQVSLHAQDNLEPSHACFHLDQEREIHVPLLQNRFEANRFSYEFNSGTGWTGKQVFVRIPGLTIPYGFRVNGFRFGSDPGTGLPSEYNITPFLREESNSIELVLDQSDPDAVPEWWTDSAEVILLIRENIHVQDVVVSIYQEDGSPETLVRIHLFIKSYLIEKNRGRIITVLVTDPQGNQVISQTEALDAPLSFGQETEMIIDRTLKDPLLWSPHNPRLYQLQIQQSEKEKTGIESMTATFGIRTAAVADSLLLINGDTLNLLVAPPELTSSLTILPESEIEKILEEGGFNAVRTDEPLPCSLVSLLDRSGVVVIRKRDQAGTRADRRHVNSPSVVRID